MRIDDHQSSKRVFKIDIPVINLDIKERVEAIQKEAEQEKNGMKRRWTIRDLLKMVKLLVKDCGNLKQWLQVLMGSYSMYFLLVV